MLYVDDVLVVSENAEAVLRQEIGKHWQLKESSIEKPSPYLGGRYREVELANGQLCWAYGAAQYVQAAVKNVEEWLAKSDDDDDDRKLPNHAEAPFMAIVPRMMYRENWSVRVRLTITISPLSAS